MVKRLVLLGILSFSILWTGLTVEAHDGNECINQETKHVQSSQVSEQEHTQDKSNSDKTDTIHNRTTCCDKNKEDN